MIKLFTMVEPFVNYITLTPQLETVMLNLFAVLTVLAMPLVIGYLFSLKSPHRPEYDAVDMWHGIGQ